MPVTRFLFVYVWAFCFRLVAAGLAPLNSNLQIRNAPGTASSDTLWALRRALSSAATVKRDTALKNSTSLDKSWVDAVILTLGAEVEVGNTAPSASIEIVCTTCYIKGTATAQLMIDGNFNASQAFQNVKSEVHDDFDNITETAWTDIKNNIDDFTFPIIPVDFDIDVNSIPQCDLSVQFDGLELYMEMNTSLSSGATYTLNIYTSHSALGISGDSDGDDFLLGVVFSVDLILSAETEIDISSGFHIRLNDGVVINIPMFDQKVSSMTFNGGNFEFLPVTIQSAGVILTAILRLGATAGFDIGTSDNITVGDLSSAFSAGIESGVWADVAQFVTNVTAAPDNDICEMRVVEVYSMLVGANAGATLAIGDKTWGPAPATQIPIYYTTLTDACAVSESSTAAASAAATVIGRDDLTTSTISTTVTYTATMCQSTGLLNCPVSLQLTSKNKVTQTLVTAVPSGSAATFPITAQSSVASTVAFGTNVKEISLTSGSLKSFVPTPSSSVSFFLNGDTEGVSNKVIIGVSIGVGIPVLTAIIAGSIFCCRRHRYAPVRRAEPAFAWQHGLQPLEPNTSYMSGKSSANVSVPDIQRQS